MSRPPAKIITTERRLPDWLRRDLSPGHEAAKTDSLIKELGLHTICESGRCPNRDECYSHKTATFMVMGDICTRSCKFCSVSIGKPEALDADEPSRIADAVKRLGLEHVVVTSVNRDDLPDEGAEHFAEVIRNLRTQKPDLMIEILTPDFKRTQTEAVARILGAGPDIFNHNVETVPRLYRTVRPHAIYETSLQIFRQIKSQTDQVLTKSGLMLGLGETETEVLSVLGDLRSAGCDILTLGQYLQSSLLGLPVHEFIHPDVFESLKQKAFAMGFSWVESGPYVRSSFHARESFLALKNFIKEKHERIGV